MTNEIAPGPTFWLEPRELADSTRALLHRLTDVRKIVEARARLVPVSLDPNLLVPRSDTRSAVPMAKTDAPVSLAELVQNAADALGLSVRWDPARRAPSVIEAVVEGWLRVHPDLLERSFSAPSARGLIEDVLQSHSGAVYGRALLRRPDGSVLPVYEAGDRRNPPIVLVMPCGMPFELSQRWLTVLGNDYFVVTWESRNMFSQSADATTERYALEAQVEDLFAVMDYYGVRRAGLFGLCVGTAIALAAAVTEPARVRALVLGNGFYSLPDCAKTPTERDLLRVVQSSKTSPQVAARMQEMFLTPGFLKTLDRRAHWTLYPYADPDLLYRYSKLCVELHAADKLGLLSKIEQPTHVIAGLADTVVHPDGSRVVAKLLKRSSLQVEPDEDHLGVFDARPKYSVPVAAFLKKHAAQFQTFHTKGES